MTGTTYVCGSACPEFNFALNSRKARDQVIAKGRRIGVGGGGRPTTAASCAFRAPISLASSINGNSSTRVARKDIDSVHLWSRNGRDWSVEFSGITAALKAWKLKSFVLDGEACACDESGWPDFNALLGGGAACATACFHAFDLLELDGVDLRHLPFSERYAKLARMLAGAPEAINLCEHTADYDGSALFEHACRLGLEGIVAKKKAARYRSGTCRSWVKVKNPDYERR